MRKQFRPIDLSERQAQISDLVREEEFFNVDYLAGRYNVTSQTIRRDLTVICDCGLARRRHGGVERISGSGNLSYRSRQILARGAKENIAKKVRDHVLHHTTLAFSISTTPEIVAAALFKHENLRIFTHNLNIAMLACSNPSFKVHIAVGRVRNNDCDVLGKGKEKLLSSYIFDIGIYGVAGLDEDGTLLDFTDDEVQARQLIHINSRKTFLVLDHSKFSSAAHVRGGQIGEATKVFCDQKPPKKIMKILDKSGCEVVLCGRNGIE